MGGVKIPPSIEALAKRDAIVACATRCSYSTTEEMLTAMVEALVADRLRLLAALESSMRMPGTKPICDKDPPWDP